MSLYLLLGSGKGANKYGYCFLLLLQKGFTIKLGLFGCCIVAVVVLLGQCGYSNVTVLVQLLQCGCCDFDC
jgi:hypothetical protein